MSLAKSENNLLVPLNGSLKFSAVGCGRFKVENFADVQKSRVKLEFFPEISVDFLSLMILQTNKNILRSVN